MAGALPKLPVRTDFRHEPSDLGPTLAEGGFRVVAPFMPGYTPTGRPKDARYQSVLLAQDSVAFITALGAPHAFVVGHDWGALATYGAAALAPERVRKIVTLAAAPPATLLGALATDDAPGKLRPALALLQEKVTTTPMPVPTLACHGAKDRPGRLGAFTSMDQFFAAGREKVILPGTGHFLHLEQPVQMNPKIVEFLRRA